MIKRYGIWLLLALGVGSLVFFGPCRLTKNAQDTLRSIQVERDDLRRVVLATGVIEPQNRLAVKPPIAGRVEEILVQEGQLVKQGDVLAWMSSTERAALLDAARAKGPEELARWTDLYKAAPLVTPIDGTVIARNVEPGQTVAATDAVLVLSDRLIAKAQVDETDISQVRVGQNASISLDAYPDENVPAHVDHVAYEAETVNNVTIYEVDVLPDTVPETMRSGMTANIIVIIEEREGALVVPTEAIRRDADQATVLAGKGRSAPIEVTLGMSDGKRTEVLTGLQEGDTVWIAAPKLSRSKQSGGNPFSPFGRRTQNRRQGS